MTDPYRITITPDGGPEPTPGGPRVDVLRPLLWLILAVALVGNTVVSVGGAPTAVHLGFGVVTALCVTALVVHHRRQSR